jgi:hypothetical protein
MRVADSFASYADLRSRLRQAIKLDGNFNLTKEFIEVPVSVPENSLVTDGATLELVSDCKIEVSAGSVVLVVPNPRVRSVGLLSYESHLTSAIAGPMQVVIRVEAECDFDIADFDYLARLYVYR